MKCKLSDIADFNPRESIKSGSIAKKVAMDKLQPFCRDIPEYEYAPFAGGVKFRNGDTIMARITPCLENGKTAKVNILEKIVQVYLHISFFFCTFAAKLENMALCERFLV